jgi:uncharacterized protein
VDDEVSTSEVPEDVTGQRHGPRSRRAEDWPFDRDCCGAAGGFDGCCLIGLTGLTGFLGMSGGLFAAIAGAGGTGRWLRQEARAPRGLFAAAMYTGVRYYQLHLSARRRGHGGCRYTPTCSAYASESLRRHGALKGTRLAAGRLRRCRPGTAGGVDPVP